jgi:drug/metabolite transporter (DMT)-like permease
VSDPVPRADEQPGFFHSTAFGTLCGLLAAVGYTACNLCLRAVMDVDPFFVCTIRAIPTIVILAPIVLARPLAGLALLPPGRIVAILAAAGLAGHVLGNGSFQYGMGIIGVALAVPLCLGSMIVGGATLGRVALNEPITFRMASGLALLVAAILVLSGGAQKASEAMHALTPSSQVGFGVAACCASGVFYAAMGAVLRHATRGLSTVSQSLTIVSTVGLIGLAGVSCWSVSRAEWAAITTNQVLMMLAAGVLNAAAFVALTRALQLMPLVHVHGLNATQATMAAVAGVLIFGEAQSSFLVSGLVLTIAGLVLMHGARQLPTQTD